MKNILIIALFAIGSLHAAMDSDQALQQLVEGNTHFVKGVSTHSYLQEAKSTLLERQTPFAAILGCSDSRVPPELLFDRGLGELFVVRNAGNVVGDIEMDSVEFAVASLKVPLVVVLGHQNCGAVKASLQGQKQFPELENIIPLVQEGLKNCDTKGEQGLVNAIQCNVRNSVAMLKKAPAIAPLIAQNKVKIVGAYYEIESGKVTFLSD